MKQSLPQQVHAQLRAKFMDGTLPPGTRLDYKALSQDLGVSTTPVREAVSQLASEGFVELIPRLGAVVRSLSPSTVKELYEIREAVECYACGKAAERISDRLLGHLNSLVTSMVELCDQFQEAELHPVEIQAFLDNDLDFHQTILRAANNPGFAKIVEDSHVKSRIFFANLSYHDLSRLAAACKQHAAIADALNARNPEAASAAMADHIRCSLQFSMDYLETIPTS